MSKLIALLSKDLSCELRGKEAITLQLTLSIILSVMAGFGVGAAFVPAAQIPDLFPVFLWLIFIFSSTISLSRSFEYESVNAALDGVILSGVSPTLIYTSKLISNIITCTLGFFLSLIIMAAMLNIGLDLIIGDLSILAFLIITGYCALSTLLGGMTMSSRLRGMLLPLILLPLLFPLLFAALELSAEIFINHNLDLSSPWVTLLIAFDLIYVVVSLNLFEHVIRE